MNLYGEILWFFAGVMTYKLGVTLLNYRHMQSFVREVTYQMLKLLGSISEDVSFAKALKYKALYESNTPKEQIENIKEIDRTTLTNWKKSTANKMVAFYPRKFTSELNFYDWDGAMKVLENIYKEEAKTQKK